jgi:hypothetical protein
MNVLTRIQAAVREGRYEVTSHAFEEAQADGFSPLDVVAAILRGRIAKRLTHDPRGTRYKIIGPAQDGRLLYAICRFHVNADVRIITVYGSGDEAEQE